MSGTKDFLRTWVKKINTLLESRIQQPVDSEHGYNVINDIKETTVRDLILCMQGEIWQEKVAPDQIILSRYLWQI